MPTLYCTATRAGEGQRFSEKRKEWPTAAFAFCRQHILPILRDPDQRLHLARTPRLDQRLWIGSAACAAALLFACFATAFARAAP